MLPLEKTGFETKSAVTEGLGCNFSPKKCTSEPFRDDSFGFVIYANF